jgi:hypothetical protein
MGGVAKQIVATCMDRADLSSYHSVEVGKRPLLSFYAGC